MKKVLVTGANRGIGKQITLDLLELGCKVYACARSLAKLETAFIEPNPNLVFVEMDVNDESSVEKASTKIKSVDVVINNAGVGVGNYGLENANLEEVKQMFETNFFGPMRVNKYFIPHLKSSDDGRIINISSQMGGINALMGGYAGYRLSKAALNTQTILLANELKPYGIKVNSMCPGWVKTDMGGAGAPRDVKQGADTAVFLATNPNIETGKFYAERKVREW